MKVALVVPKTEMPKLKYSRKVQKQYSERGQVFPNMSLCYLASTLEKEGHEVRIIDANVLGLSIGETVNLLRGFGPGAVGFNILTEGFRDSVPWMRAVKDAVGAPLIVGGFHLKLYPRETMTHPFIDYAAVGQAWHTFPELLSALECGERDVSGIQGLCYREGDEVVMTVPREDPTTLDDVPFPARHLIPNERYSTILTKQWPITVMLTGQGCPFHCIYCDMAGWYQPRDPLLVVDEIEECISRFGIREFYFQDETFTVNRKKVFTFCNEILRRGIKTTFAIRTRADCVTREMLMLLKETGCIRINFGIETGDDRISRNIKRNITCDQMRDAVRWAKEAGLMTLGFFLLGTPGETVESIRKTIALAIELDTDFVSISKLVPVPNSELYDLIVKETGRDYWREYTLGNWDVINDIAYYKCGVSAADLDLWLQRAYRAFYFRPRYILRTLSRVRSLKEFYGLLTSAWSIL